MPPKVPALINGDALDADEFLRRYEAMPEINKAELINGIVFIADNMVRADTHGEQHAFMNWWVGSYSMSTPGVQGSSRTTTCLSAMDVLQPDVSLRYLSSRSGREQIDSRGFLNCAPELIIEIAATHAAIEMHLKREAYQRSRVQEYIVWCTESSEFNWWFLKDAAYNNIQKDADGIIRSHVYPGLWLNPNDLLADDRKRVREVLELGLKSKEHAAFAKK